MSCHRESTLEAQRYRLRALRGTDRDAKRLLRDADDGQRRKNSGRQDADTYGDDPEEML